MKRVIIESPYAGDVEENERYLRACLRDALLRDEAPFASHAIYTLPGVLDDTDPDERKLGMRAGFSWIGAADLTLVYVDRGISRGMAQGILKASDEDREIEFRSLRETDLDRVRSLVIATLQQIEPASLRGKVLDALGTLDTDTRPLANVLDDPGHE